MTRSDTEKEAKSRVNEKARRKREVRREFVVEINRLVNEATMTRRQVAAIMTMADRIAVHGEDRVDLHDVEQIDHIVNILVAEEIPVPARTEVMRIADKNVAEVRKTRNIG